MVRKIIEGLLYLTGVLALAAVVWWPHEWWRLIISAVVLLVGANTTAEVTK